MSLIIPIIILSYASETYFQYIGPSVMPNDKPVYVEPFTVVVETFVIVG